VCVPPGRSREGFRWRALNKRHRRAADARNAPTLSFDAFIRRFSSSHAVSPNQLPCGLAVSSPVLGGAGGLKKFLTPRSFGHRVRLSLSDCHPSPVRIFRVRPSRGHPRASQRPSCLRHGSRAPPGRFPQNASNDHATPICVSLAKWPVAAPHLSLLMRRGLRSVGTNTSFLYQPPRASRAAG
jgi:hypothetical protein